MAAVGRISNVYSSPIGPLKLTATEEGILAVKFLFGKHEDVEGASVAGVTGEDGVKEDLTDEKEPGAGAESHLNVCSKWLDAYFQGTLLKSDAPPPPRPKLALTKKGSFFHTVWDTLLNTDIGDTLSYKELAKLSGNPKAARAVGQAVKRHCIPILVPCHRVVKSASGGRGRGCEVGNYSGGDGTNTKVWLLAHEKKMVTQSSAH